MTTPATFREALRVGRELLAENGVSNPGLDSRILLAGSSGREPSYFFAYPGEELSATTWDRYISFIHRRARLEPVSYILGRKEFWSMPFAVTQSTLIPRPETETLVRHVLDFIRGRAKERLKILDIGTGCGNIPVSIAAETKNVLIFSSDISGDALRVAKANASRLNFQNRIHFVRGDIVGHFRKGLDVIVSNPPYIKNGDLGNLPSDVITYEPRSALAAGDDGLLFFRKIVEGASHLLTSKGGIFFEVGDDQAEEVEGILGSSGSFTDITTFKDLSRTPRVVTGKVKR